MGFQSSSDTRLHFGLDTSSVIDSILIVWPDQKFQKIKNFSANKQFVVQKENASGKFNYNDHFKKSEILFAIQNEVDIKWQHKENYFVDYNVQYLIPHAQSTRGPKLAVADVNKKMQILKFTIYLLTNWLLQLVTEQY